VVTGGRRTLNATKAVVVERSACVILSKSRDKDHKESEDEKFEHDRRQILKLEWYQNQQNFYCFCWLAAQLQQLHFPGKTSGTSGEPGNTGTESVLAKGCATRRREGEKFNFCC
jgi:hypothetical protein